MSKFIKMIAKDEPELMEFIENLRSFVVEETFFDENGIMNKRIHVLKDREGKGLLEKDFCVCDFGDLRKIAASYKTALFEVPDGINKDRMDLWVLCDRPNPICTDGNTLKLPVSKLSQPAYIQLYKKRLIPNKKFKTDLPSKLSDEIWESKLNIGILFAELYSTVGSVLLYDPYKGNIMPMKMNPATDPYKIKIANLSTLFRTQDELIKHVSPKTTLMLVIVVDMPEIAALIPLAHSGEIPAITDIALTPISLAVPYDSAMNNCIDI